LYGLEDNPSGKVFEDHQKKLPSHFTPVPCPNCLLYPDYMTRRVGNPVAGRCAVVTKGAFYVALLCGFVSLITWCALGGDVAVWFAAVAGLLVVLAIGSIIGGIASNVGYDANNKGDEGERKKVAERHAFTRAEFEASRLRDAETSLADRMATAEEDPRARLRLVPVLFWHVFTGNDPRTNRAVTLPSGEVFRFDMPDDAGEFDEFDLTRTVKGERIVFRVQVRFYHPTLPGREDLKQAEKKLTGRAEQTSDWIEEKE
jgi:hypothetical protein